MQRQNKRKLGREKKRLESTLCDCNLIRTFEYDEECLLYCLLRDVNVFPLAMMESKGMGILVLQGKDFKVLINQITVQVTDGLNKAIGMQALTSGDVCVIGGLLEDEVIVTNDTEKASKKFTSEVALMFDLLPKSTVFDVAIVAYFDAKNQEPFSSQKAYLMMGKENISGLASIKQGKGTIEFKKKIGFDSAKRALQVKYENIESYKGNRVDFEGLWDAIGSFLSPKEQKILFNVEKKFKDIQTEENRCECVGFSSETCFKQCLQRDPERTVQDLITFIDLTVDSKVILSHFGIPNEILLSSAILKIQYGDEDNEMLQFPIYSETRIVSEEIPEGIPISPMEEENLPVFMEDEIEEIEMEEPQERVDINQVVNNIINSSPTSISVTWRSNTGDVYLNPLLDSERWEFLSNTRLKGTLKFPDFQDAPILSVEIIPSRDSDTDYGNLTITWEVSLI